MPNPSNQPNPYDAVLGGQTRPEPDAAVLGGNSRSRIQAEVIEPSVQTIEGTSPEIINEDNKKPDVIQEEKVISHRNKEDLLRKPSLLLGNRNNFHINSWGWETNVG